MDILSEPTPENPLPETTKNPTNITVLKPKILTTQDLEEQQKEAAATEEIEKAFDKGKDPYENEEAIAKLGHECDLLEKVVQGYLKTPSTFDTVWKEMNRIVEEDTEPKTISVARCYPMKNRFPDVLPFDRLALF